MNRLLIKPLVACALAFGLVQTSSGSPDESTNTVPIDLPSALRLAGAQNLDVQIAREKLREAQANVRTAVQQFFPWLAPGVSYHRRDGVAQAVPSGIISDAHFQSYSPGISLSAQVVLGDAIYSALAAKQMAKASDQALESQRQGSVLAAAQGYFELTKARGQVDVLREAVRTSEEYQKQLQSAVAAGIAFKGDQLRVQSQTERYQLSVRRAQEQERAVAGELARLLHIDPTVELVPEQQELAPLSLLSTNTSRELLVQQALARRPELKERRSQFLAALAWKEGAVYGPWIPTVGAQVFAGGLGGGPYSGPTHFAAEGDYSVGLSWRIGPGGLFDAGRIRANEARLSVAELQETKLRDVIVAEVVIQLNRVRSLSDQIELANRNLATATETLRLTRERKQYGVGIVLEDIQAQQDLTQARSDYLASVAEYNKAQYALAKAVGGL